MVCPFCRAEDSINDKEFLKRLWKRIDEYKDPKAMFLLGHYYSEGEKGLSKNLKKAKELYQQAYDFGDPNAAYHLAEMYTKHIPDPARMMKYLEGGVKREHTPCMNTLAICAA
jgi:TPR repeat protein